MGTWSTTLYGNDLASDLRDDFRDIVRAPWDADRLVFSAAMRYPDALDSASDEYTEFWLVVADLLWTYGIDHAQTFDTARRIVASGQDLEAKKALGMSGQDLRRRARLLGTLVERWAVPNPKPRHRNVRSSPEPFILEPGDCLAYPTTKGELRNPYVTPGKEEWFFRIHPWQPDGWGAAVVLRRYHRFEVFARYLVAVLASDPARRLTLAEVPGTSIRQSRGWATPGGVAATSRYVVPIALSPSHLRRMEIELIGRLPVDTGLVERELGADSPAVARWGDGRSLANIGGTGPYLRLADVDDPVGRYLRRS